MADAAKLAGPDLTQWTEVSGLSPGERLVGHAFGKPVLLVRTKDGLHAVGATCSHYGGPLGEGIVVGHEVHCPWHHARFDVRDGRSVRAPGINPIPSYALEVEGGRARVTEARHPLPTPRPAPAPGRILIVGAGPAGACAAETLRSEGYGGEIVLLGAEGTVPMDRPNLSKDYLAGNAPDEWLPIRDEAFFEGLGVTFRKDARVTGISTAKKTVTLQSGETLGWDALLLATGAQPVKLKVPGADLPHVLTLRTLADSHAIIERAKTAKKAVVIGASFIGLEVAASLRERGLEVDVVGLERVPLERVLGLELGSFVQKLHEEHGVRFHLQRGVASIRPDGVTLEGGEVLPGELVVAGVGVRPDTALAEAAGCKVDHGVVTDARLETSVPGIYAAGDVARWPEGRSGTMARIEHWVLAEELGKAAARSMAGKPVRFDRAPFFWSQHYDVPINYVGYADRYDQVQVSGSIQDKDCLVAYRKEGRILAVASIYRDRDSLLAEDAMERGDDAALERLLR